MDPEEEEVIDLEKGMKFKAYSSIQLSTRGKFIKKITNEGYADEEVLWVASEKIHGSNFSVHFNGEVARYGRRTDFLSNDIPVPCEDVSPFFKQNFNNAKAVVVRFHNKLGTIYKRLQVREPELVKFTVYGEYFGGGWPENVVIPDLKVENKCNTVQKGVFYTPYHEFYAFDVFITTKEKAYWANVLDIPDILEGVIPSVPVYAKGTFEQLINIESKIDSTIPQLLGLPKLKENIIEGFVIRPNENKKCPAGERVMIKKKNAEFNEKVSEPKAVKKEKKEAVIDPQLAPYLEEILKYLNFNRIESVISKFPDLKDRRKLANETVKDILDDAAKDEFKEPKDIKKFQDELLKAVMKELTSYFIKH